MSDKVLSVNNLVINFKTDNGTVHAVRDVSFDLERGETLCIVGESGSGKSVTSKAIMGILANNAIIENGNIMYRGENLLEVSEDEFYKIRGHKIGMIFQDPLSSLNPIVKIGKQITEAMLINSDKLKLMYNDLISDDLIAYKNTLAKMNIQINSEKKKIVLFENEHKKVIEGFEKEQIKLKYAIKKKEIELKEALLDLKYRLEEKNKEEKMNFFNERSILDEKSRTLKGNVAAAKNNKEEEKAQKYIEEINKINAEKVSLQQQYNEKISNYTAEYNQNVQEVSAKFKQEISEITEDVNKKVAEIDLQIKEEKEKYAAELKELKAPLKEKIANIKKEAKEKAAPLKVKLNETKKAAKIKVNEYKQGILVEHQSKLNDLKHQLANAYDAEEKAKIEKQIKEEKMNCVNKLKITKAEAKRRAIEIMKEVGIPEPEKRFKQYPFEFSGGMRQRIVIAIALTETPEILICDEPTTALDVTIQAQILELINSIKKERNLSCIFITHDLGVVANMADRVAVMYAGKIVEYGTADEIFYDPRHPYTWALLSSIPDVDSKERLEAIPGTPPNMIYPPKGDAFALRSKYAMKIDFEVEPPMFKVTDTHYAATWLLDERAPKVEMPKIVSERIKNSLEGDK